MTPWSNPFYLVMALLVMGLVIWAVPAPVRPILIAPIVLGALLALAKIGRATRAKGLARGRAASVSKGDDA